MNSFSLNVKNAIMEFSPNEIIVAKSLYTTKFNNTNENLFYKVLERMCLKNELRHIGKGIYIRPMITKYGEIPISDSEIIKFYTKNNSGIRTGYSLLNQKGITTQTTNKFKILSNAINENKKIINNVEIIRINFHLNKERKLALEILETIDNFNSTENASYMELIKMIDNYTKSYNDKSIRYVIDNKKYKKSTIASLKYILDKFNVKNTLNTYLSPLSKYKLIKE